LCDLCGGAVSTNYVSTDSSTFQQTAEIGNSYPKDLQLVLSGGDQIDPNQIGPVPNNAIIVKRAPQLELLKQTSVCITHAGLNTVLESLAQGVPQVAIPVTYDQPGVAARIAHKQTGVVTSLDNLTADHLSTLLNEVLNHSTYRDNARKLQKAIVKSRQAKQAALGVAIFGRGQRLEPSLTVDPWQMEVNL
jgi:MGT family glycosyltransferase